MKCGSENLYLEAMRSLVSAIDARDRYKCAHARNVERLATAIAIEMSLPEEEIEGIRTAALLHDIGALGIPEYVRLKPGKLDDSEFARMQKHTILGQQILHDVSFPWPVGKMIRAHHERWDGTGYPDGLKGEEIPQGARILCVADVYDAMTSARAYRDKNSPGSTLDYIRASAGTHFDQTVVEALDSLIENGKLDLLSDEDADTSHRQFYAAADDGNTDNISGVADISSASREFVAMFEIAQTASNSLCLPEATSILATKVKNMIPCALCVLFLKDEGSENSTAKAALGDNSQYYSTAVATAGKGITGRVMVSGHGTIAEYDSGDVLLPQLPSSGIKPYTWVNFKNMMVAPVISEGDVIGTLNLYRTKGKQFTDEDLSLLTGIATYVGQAVRNAELFEQTRVSALTDPLTSLRNSRYMRAKLENEISMSRFACKPISVLGMDLDNFKDINDTFGHDQGDSVLRDVAKVFLSQVRSYDLVARNSGDEFVIVMPNTTMAEAQQTKIRIQQAIDSLPGYGKQGKEIHVGVSIGVASYPDGGLDVQSLLATADKRMYEDKRKRKSRPAAA